MEASVIVAAVGSGAALLLGLYNARRAATKSEMEVVLEKLTKCEHDRETMMMENRQLTRENVEYARRLLDLAKG